MGLPGSQKIDQSLGMDASIDFARAFREWRDQELALFGRRAHRQLGRGFVLTDGDDSPPIYVTRMAGAPHALIEAVYDYDPEREALVVCEDRFDDDSIVISCVRIDSRH
jgi:hypothetical protein